MSVRPHEFPHSSHAPPAPPALQFISAIPPSLTSPKPLLHKHFTTPSIQPHPGLRSPKVPKQSPKRPLFTLRSPPVRSKTPGYFARTGSPERGLKLTSASDVILLHSEPQKGGSFPVSLITHIFLDYWELWARDPCRRVVISLP
jgi:hypothetical protein